MECIVCGRNESELEKWDNEIISKINKVLEIIENKKKIIKDKMKDDNANEIKYLGTELGQLKKEIKTIKQGKELFKKSELVDVDITKRAIFQFHVFDKIINDSNLIIEKYLNIKESDIEKSKICTRCELILNGMYKIYISNDDDDDDDEN
jgi:hypothetical protein